MKSRHKLTKKSVKSQKKPATSPVEPVVKTKQEKVREILDLIDNALATESRVVAEDVWDVLSALRGPDAESAVAFEIKLATTAVIRKVAFPRLFAGNTLFSKAMSRFDDEGKLETRSRDTRTVVGWHFHNHVANAFYSLGLKYEEVNK